MNKLFEKFANLVLKIRTPLQLAGVAIVAVVFGLTSSRFNIKDALMCFGVLILYCLAVGTIEALPERSRAGFLFKSLALGTIIFVSALVITRAIETYGGPKAEGPAHFTAAEQKVVDLLPQIDQIRSSYVLLLGQPDKARDVNRDARHLADRLAAIDDADLGVAIQVCKYEAIAYSWAMVAESEPDSAKLKTIEEILRVTGKGQQLIEDVMRPGPYEPRIQNWREWIIRDNAPQRLQRLTAVALCARWEVKKNNDDLVRVREIVGNFPYDYRKDEAPDTSPELRPCLSGTGGNERRNSGRATSSGKGTGLNPS